jgi:hypothetical protein
MIKEQSPYKLYTPAVCEHLPLWRKPYILPAPPKRHRQVLCDNTVQKSPKMNLQKVLLLLVFSLSALFSTSCIDPCKDGGPAFHVDQCEKEFGEGSLETATCIKERVDDWDYGLGDASPEYACYEWYIDKYDIDVIAIDPIEWYSPDS